MRYPLALFISCGFLACSVDKDPADSDGGSAAGDATLGLQDLGHVDGQMTGGDGGFVADAVVDGSVAAPDASVVPMDARITPTADAGVITDNGLPPVRDGAMTPPDVGPGQAGHVPTSCGSEAQDLTPVDCTARGDVTAQCVFSNHCMCSVGFVCEAETQWPNTSECDPGSICIPRPPDRPEGARADSCGAEDQGLEPVDCTANGDDGAACVFSNHCMCSDGFVCADTGRGGECEPGQSCARPR